MKNENLLETKEILWELFKTIYTNKAIIIIILMLIIGNILLELIEINIESIKLKAVIIMIITILYTLGIFLALSIL